jgi:PBP1b-binding outer membrane lipoprotein LpoB
MKLKTFKSIGFIFVLILLLVGCQNAEFVSSEMNDDFPVLSNAQKIDSGAENPNIKAYQKYKYSKSDEIGSINKDYLEAIMEWG